MPAARPVLEACPLRPPAGIGELRRLLAALPQHNLPQHNANLPALHVSCCRDAWGRLQRLSGGGWGKAAPAAQHPPPFGSAPGTAYRPYRSPAEE